MCEGVGGAWGSWLVKAALLAAGTEVKLFANEGVAVEAEEPAASGTAQDEALTTPSGDGAPMERPAATGAHDPHGRLLALV